MKPSPYLRWILIAAAMLLSVAVGIGIAWRQAAHRSYRAIEAFRELTLEDPLFWDPALDPNALEEQIQRLERVGGELSAFAKTQGISGRVMWWPITFLRELPEIGRRTQTVLDAPSATAIAGLLGQYRKILYAYEIELSAFERVAEERLGILPSTDQRVLEEENIIPGTYEYDLAQFFALAEQNVAALRDEITRRARCAATGQSCEPLLNDSPQIPAPSPLPKLPDAIALPNPASLPLAVEGPVYVPSSCWSQKRAWHQLYLLEQELPGGILYRRTKLADENIYRAVHTDAALKKIVAEGPADAVTATFERLHLEAGLPFSLENDGRFRRCSDFSHYPKTITLLWLIDELKTNGSVIRGIDERVIGENAQQIIRDALDAEKNLLETSLPSWNDALTLSAAISRLLLLEREGRIALPDDHIKRMARIRSGISSGLPRFEKVLQALGDDLAYIVLPIWKDPEIGMPPQHQLVWETSYWSLLYFPFSSAFWRIPDQPPYTRSYVFDTAPISAAKLTELRNATYRQLFFLSQIRSLFDLPTLIRFTQTSQAIKHSY